MKIVITGAADGLGREIAVGLKSHSLILIDYDKEKLFEVAKKLKAEAHVCDLSQADEITEVCKDILANNSKIDVLINCAGVWLNESKEKNLEKYKNMILVNLFGPIGMIKSLMPRFLKQKSGLIININSKAGVEIQEGSSVYGATKTGLVAYRKNIRDTLAKNGVRITDICPGMIETGLFEKAGVEYSADIFKTYSLRKSQVVSVVKFVITQSSEVLISSVEIKNVNESSRK
jgi:short-subunit dehydrogenase